MYLVIATQPITGYKVGKYETLDEAKEVIKGLVAAGQRNVMIAQEIPMKLKVEVEF
ncbi:hypothetical protein P4T04_05265 [Bacillus badius]|uniref:hypothetical protein n=1 Tax=Bacillus badius TaxID=1455 RepID=UPI002E1B7FAE|nr:hypothetical protein [Bacillus badius]